MLRFSNYYCMRIFICDACEGSNLSDILSNVSVAFFSCIPVLFVTDRAGRSVLLYILDESI